MFKVKAWQKSVYPRVVPELLAQVIIGGVTEGERCAKDSLVAKACSNSNK